MNFKLSYYTVITPIEIDSQIESYIIYATRTSETIVISKNIYELLISENFEKISKDVFAKLRQYEVIVEREQNELEYILDYNKNKINNSSVLYHVIQPTANCQLGCGYCGQQHTKSALSANLYSEILNRIESKIDKTIKKLCIGWFGSEPLMGLKGIRELSPKLIDMAARYDLKYSSKLVTNGLSLKEDIFSELVNQHKVVGMEITLDGTAEFHDKRRHTKENHSTFDIIFNNIVNVCNSDTYRNGECKISLRCNVDNRNKESVIPLLRLLADNNLQDKIAGFYVAPIHSWGNDAHLLSMTKEEFADAEIDWIIEMFRLGFNFPLTPKRQTNVCMVVDKRAELFDAYGNVFNCTETSYVPMYEKSKYVLGNAKQMGDVKIGDDRPFNNWNDLILQGESKSPCQTCKILPVCGGACPKSWDEGNKTCPSIKFNVEDRILLQYLYSTTNVLEVVES